MYSAVAIAGAAAPPLCLTTVSHRATQRERDRERMDTCRQTLLSQTNKIKLLSCRHNWERYFSFRFQINRNLYKIMKENETNDMFLFVNPFGISYAPKASRDDRARALSDRLLNATSKQVVLVPCNVGEHWILTIIQPHIGRVYLMDPLAHRNRDSTWKFVVDTAMNIFNAQMNKKSFKRPPTWKVIKDPLQPDSKQCGYYIMRFMKEIVKGIENDVSVSVASLFPDQRKLWQEGLKHYDRSAHKEVCPKWLQLEYCKHFN